MGEEDRPEKRARRGGSRLEEARSDLDDAKSCFAQAADLADPVDLIREKPFLSTGGAFLLGFGLTSLGRKLAILQLLPLLLESAESISRILMNLRKN